MNNLLQQHLAGRRLSRVLRAYPPAIAAKFTGLIGALRKLTARLPWQDRSGAAVENRAGIPLRQAAYGSAEEQVDLESAAMPDEEFAGAGAERLNNGEVVLQHVVRIRDASGREYVHATLRGELPAGERRTTLYLGFCPPFAGRPQVEAELMEGPPAVARVVQSLHNGAQLEVELDAAATEDSAVTIEVAAYQPDADPPASQ